MRESETRYLIAHRPHVRRTCRALGLLLGLALVLPACGDPGGVADDSWTDEEGEWSEQSEDIDKALPTARYQAEAFTLQSGCAVATNQAGYTGTGFMDFGGNGTWIEWNNINASLAGQYTLTLRYANGGAAARPAAVTVNSVSAGTAQFPITSTWTAWTTTSLVVSLSQGNNTIRIAANTSTGGPNVDYADVTGLDLCTSDPNKTEPGVCGCSVADVDTDRDGTFDCQDQCPSDPAKVVPGSCGCGVADGVCGGRFSAPNAALHTLNSNKQRAFARYIDSNFEGNGHSETWDGRVFVVRNTGGWQVRAFRPERVTIDADRAPNFGNQPFGTRKFLEDDATVAEFDHNWVALTPDPTVSGANPYPSDAAGTPQANGTSRTYKALAYHTTVNKELGLRKLTLIVGNANTTSAEVTLAQFTSTFAPIILSNGGAKFLCIEPSVTMDARLVVCQGHPDNNGTIDNLVYAWTANAGGANGFSTPRSLANMYYDHRDSDVRGLPFKVRYPIAEKPITDATGTAYLRGELIKGAYPWISHDGSELFYMASRDGITARRTGASVVGRWTGWSARHIDGPLNRDRRVTSRLFVSSPGAFTTMWEPYKNLANSPFPYTARGPSYPIFGSNTEDYSEVSFEDFTDGSYVLYLGMNEQLDRAGVFQVNATNDTSGNFNNGRLVGAKFPLEYNARDENVGRHGQGVYFPANAYMDVERRGGWSSLKNGVTVETFVMVQQSTTARSTLFSLAAGVELYLNGLTLGARIEDDTARSATVTGPAIATNRWVHVAMTFEPKTRALALHVDGLKVASTTPSAFGNLRTTGAVRVGPQASSGLMLLDEIKVSKLARAQFELGHSAHAQIHTTPTPTQLGTIPSHLQSLSHRATAVDRFSTAAPTLGQDLFSQTLLSKQRTTSCATCHDPAKQFTDGLAIARGGEPTDKGTRNTPTLLNRQFSTLQGWSGRAATLDAQATIPITAGHEMNLPMVEALQRLNAEGTWASRFQQVYGEAPTERNLTAALASFQATKFSPRTRLDDFKAGTLTALNASEQRGLLLFEGKARCSGCHSGRNFTDETFRSNGLTDNGDIGRAEISLRESDYKLFKVPSLSAVSATAPYMHAGSLSTLQAVVEAYNQGARTVVFKDTDIRPLELTTQDITDLVAFLNSL